MEHVLHNDYRQQPITSDEAYGQYRHYLAKLEALIAEQEDIVIQARTHTNLAELTRARTSLWRLLTKRQGVLDELAAYERQRAATQE
jgi:hypothetical protein